MVEGHQPETREGQAGPYGVADRLVVPEKPGNAGGGKGPDFGHAWEGNNGRESGASLLPPPEERPGDSRNKLGLQVKLPGHNGQRVPEGDVRRRAGCGKSARPVRRAGCGNGARRGY